MKILKVYHCNLILLPILIALHSALLMPRFMQIQLGQRAQPTHSIDFEESRPKKVNSPESSIYRSRAGVIVVCSRRIAVFGVSRVAPSSALLFSPFDVLSIHTHSRRSFVIISDLRLCLRQRAPKFKYGRRRQDVFVVFASG